MKVVPLKRYAVVDLTLPHLSMTVARFRHHAAARIFEQRYAEQRESEGLEVWPMIVDLSR